MESSSRVKLAHPCLSNDGQTSIYNTGACVYNNYNQIEIVECCRGEGVLIVMQEQGEFIMTITMQCYSSWFY